MMVLLRDLVLSCLWHNILFQARHIPGLQNSSADYLSRSHVVNFKDIFPETEESPTQIPENLMPKNWVLTWELFYRRSYQREWIIFRQFYRQFYDSDDTPLPVPPTCLPLFISYLTFRKLAISAISSYLSAIS